MLRDRFGVSQRRACKVVGLHRSTQRARAPPITDDEAEIEQMRQNWERLNTEVPLVIIESPYRSIVGPLLSYLDEIERQRPEDTITVVLPEFIARHWWEQFLHNQTALRIKASLLDSPATREQVTEDPAEDVELQTLTFRLREMTIFFVGGGSIGAMANKQIATRLGISERTVKGHLGRVFREIGVADRTSAALWARENLPDL